MPWFKVRRGGRRPRCRGGRSPRGRGARLPASFVPAQIRVEGRPEIPVGTSGKTDRRRLAATAPPRPAAAGVGALLRSGCARWWPTSSGLVWSARRTTSSRSAATSLRVLRLIADATRPSSLALSPPTSAHPTPAGLAALAGTGPADAGTSGGARSDRERSDLAETLILRPVGDRPPLVLLPPAGGLGWCYASLLRSLPADQGVLRCRRPGSPTARPSRSRTCPRRAPAGGDPRRCGRSAGYSTWPAGRWAAWPRTPSRGWPVSRARRSGGRAARRLPVRPVAAPGRAHRGGGPRRNPQVGRGRGAASRGSDGGPRAGRRGAPPRRQCARRAARARPRRLHRERDRGKQGRADVAPGVLDGDLDVVATAPRAPSAGSTPTAGAVSSPARSRFTPSTPRTATSCAARPPTGWARSSPACCDERPGPRQDLSTRPGAPAWVTRSAPVDGVEDAGLLTAADGERRIRLHRADDRGRRSSRRTCWCGSARRGSGSTSNPCARSRRSPQC